MHCNGSQRLQPNGTMNIVEPQVYDGDRLAVSGAGAISTQVLAEFFVAATRKIANPLSVPDACERVLNYLQSWTVLEVSGMVVLEAARGVRDHPYELETDAFTELKSANTSGASPTLQIIVIPVDPPVQVDNATNSYRLRVAPGVASSAHLLRSARVGYTVPSAFLPIVAR